MLHLIKQSPFSSNSLELCLAYLQNDDVILLLEDAVIAAVDGHIWLEKLQKSNVSFFVLQEDAAARALIKKVSSSVKLIDINGFVELTERYETVISW